MAKLHSTQAMLAICGGITLVVIALVNLTGGDTAPAQVAQQSSPVVVAKAPSKTMLDISAHAGDGNKAPTVWAASATGRIETRTGEHRLSAVQPRSIEKVLVKTHDLVKAGDLLVRLDDQDLNAKRDSALAEVQVRLRERAEEKVTGLARDRQKAEDKWAKAERDLFEARQAFDAAFSDHRDGKIGEDAVETARKAVASAETDAATQRTAYDAILANDDIPRPTRLDTGLTQSRADLALVENEIEKTRVRAPFAGTVLNVWAKVGEVATPSASAPLVLFGDSSEMRVRAELEERDLVKVRVGQKVVVRSDAHPGKDFVGKVTSLGGALGARNIASRGPRRPSDIDVLEVVANLGARPQLLPGMRVDVFFANDETAKVD